MAVASTSRVASRSVALAALITAALGVSCAEVPPGRLAIDEVSIQGADAVDAGDLEELIATADSPKFLGLFRGLLVDYELFDPLTLQRDLARIERAYMARGFYQAQARAGRVIRTADNRVRVAIVVHEGPAVALDHVVVTGLEGLPPQAVKKARRAAREALPEGRRFEEERFEKAEAGIRRALNEASYAYAEVRREAFVDIVSGRANAYFAVTPGPPCEFGPVTIEGLGEVPENKVRDALDLSPGEPYSASAIASAEDALLNLGVFSSVTITPVKGEPPVTRVPLRVRVQPMRPRTLSLGGGFELDALKTAAHLTAGWENRNFFGGLRKFSADIQPGLVFYPTRIGQFVATTDVLFEGRLRLMLRQPGFFEGRTTAFVSPQIGVLPILLRTEVEPDDPVLGYLEAMVATGVERSFWRFFGRLSYHAAVEDPFSYKGVLDPALSTLFISHLELLASFDARDSALEPRKGVYIANSLQLAGGFLQGAADDVRVEPEIRVYAPVTRKITFAARAALGFLFPRNYGEDLEQTLLEPFTEANQGPRTRELQILLFRGLFSGGPSSNRGYSLRAVGPHGVVPFLTPQSLTSPTAPECAIDSPDYDVERCAVPVGGLTLWEASAELRFGIAGPFSAATFCDAGDVSATRTDIRLAYLHLSCGGGLRYATPIGPVRLDVGLRIPGLQVPSDANPYIERPPDKLLGLPIAVAFAIGEAF